MRTKVGGWGEGGGDLGGGRGRRRKKKKEDDDERDADDDNVGFQKDGISVYNSKVSN